MSKAAEKAAGLSAEQFHRHVIFASCDAMGDDDQLV